VLLAMLAQLDQCESIVVHSRADLHSKSFFSVIAEEFGEASGRNGLRNADNDLTMDEVGEEVHDASQVFTGAFYDILADIFDDERNPDIRDDAETLFRVGEHMTDLVVESFLRGPPQNATFKDVAEKMIYLEKKNKWKSFIRHHFQRRGVLGARRVKPPSKPV
jgi:hypothetical protein